MPMNQSKPQPRDLVLLLGFTLCGFSLIFYSKPISAAVTQALTLCTQVLLPSLFPFFVFSALLIDSHAVQPFVRFFEKPFRFLFGLPGCFSTVLLLGAVGGYPVGARTAANTYQQGLCSRADAEKALYFCNNAGPAFLIGAIGTGLLGDARLGLQLYGIHLLSALTLGFINRKRISIVKSNSFPPIPEKRVAGIPLFLHAVRDSFSAYLNVCAFVLIFAVLSCLLMHLPIAGFLQRLPGGSVLWRGLLSGTLELTSGISLLAHASLPPVILLPVLSFLCGWGGFSVQLQTISILRDEGLSCRRYLKGKLLHGIVSAMLTAIICR